MSTKTEHRMSDEARALLSQIRRLPDRDQVEIAASLIESIDIEDDELDEAQFAEMERRSDEIDRGVVNLVPLDEAMQLIRERKKI